MLFIDKYIPKNGKESILHKKEIELLERMSQDESIPHIIFYGPQGCGKKILIRLFLQMLYDDDVNNLTETICQVEGSGNNTKDICIEQSNNHIIIEPNNNNFDRYLIQDIVKDYAKKIPLSVYVSNKKFKVVLINNIGNMSHYAQTSLRRTMEKYSKTCRFIMCCRSLSKVIEPLKSRCYCFRVSSPSDTEMFKLCMNVSSRDKLALKLSDYAKFINTANGNIKKLLWILELRKKHLNYKTDYDKVISVINNLILNYKHGNVLTIRVLLYKITETNISGTDIIKSLTLKLLQSKDIDNITKVKIVESAGKFEHNLIRGRREINHLDAYIIDVISMLN